MKEHPLLQQKRLAHEIVVSMPQHIPDDTIGTRESSFSTPALFPTLRRAKAGSPTLAATGLPSGKLVIRLRRFVPPFLHE